MRLTPRRRSFLPFEVALFALLGACVPTDSEQVTIEANAPIGKVEAFGSRMVIYPAPGVRAEQIVDLRLFENLQPGMTFEEVSAVLGEPQVKGVGPRGPWVRYARDRGTLEVAWEEERSGFASSKSWRLMGFPARSSLAEWVDPEIVRVLSSDPRSTVTIMGSLSGSPSVQLDLDELQVSKIVWLWSGHKVNWSGAAEFGAPVDGAAPAQPAPDSHKQRTGVD